MRILAQTLLVANLLLLLVLLPTHSIAGGSEQNVCEVHADYYLGIEDYRETIRLHLEVIREHPASALAHYHLGFALGMAGNIAGEIDEYRQAAALGLTNWDLYLNLGLAQLETGDVAAATNSLQRAVLLGDDHFEAHFNLALADERHGQLAEAEEETLAALVLNPRDPDARNLLSVVFAKEGRSARACEVWKQLVRDVPVYEPAKANLRLLGSSQPANLGEEAAAIFRTPAAFAHSERAQ